MGQTWRRLWRTLGRWGVFYLAMTAVLLPLIAMGGLSWRHVGVLKPVVLLLIGLFAVNVSWGRYRPSARTRWYREVLDPLMSSREEYCLLLRPFGSDGEVLVPHVLRRGRHLSAVAPTLTLEQVIERAARERLGFATYAMVDADRTLAPPGPVYLRAPHEEWQQAARLLIRRAHSIVIALPPDQHLRAAMDWELGEIVAARRESRVIVVLPPCDDRRYDYPAARRQASTVLVALQRRCRLGAVTSAEVMSTEARMPARTLVVKTHRDGPAVGFTWWFVEPGRSAGGRPWWRRWGPKDMVASVNYVEGIGDLLAATEAELARQPFERRYPQPVPRTAPGPG